MKQIVVTDVELNALLDRLELKKLKDSGNGHYDKVPPELLESAHRFFHYHVVSWIQAVGGEVKRS